jgi:hypothetical protein
LRRVYDLRHTFATFALRAGISTFDLSRYREYQAASAPKQSLQRYAEAQRRAARGPRAPRLSCGLVKSSRTA